MYVSTNSPLPVVGSKHVIKTYAYHHQWEDLLVRFLGWYENVDFVFIAMEYIEYGDLSQYQRTSGALSLSNARDITRQLLEGLAVLHEMKICHRDLKPQVRTPHHPPSLPSSATLRILQNVLIASLQPIWVKLSDFGVSKSRKGTVLHTRIGSQGYFAPELLGILPVRDMKNTYTNAVDIWALGCIVHELLTVEIPFLEIENFDTGFSGLTPNPGSDVDCVLLPQTDVTILKDFCDGTIAFPTDSLGRCKVNNEAVDFVRALLVAEPKSRATAKEALQMAWLIQKEGLGMNYGHLNNLLGSPESPEGAEVVSTSVTIPELCLLWLPSAPVGIIPCTPAMTTCPVAPPMSRIFMGQGEKTSVGVEVDRERAELKTEAVKASHVIRTSEDDAGWKDGANVAQGESSRIHENRSSSQCGQVPRVGTGDGGTDEVCLTANLSLKGWICITL